MSKKFATYAKKDLILMNLIRTKMIKMNLILMKMIRMHLIHLMMKMIQMHWNCMVKSKIIVIIQENLKGQPMVFVI